jgi:hypothetical protein
MSIYSGHLFGMCALSEARISCRPKTRRPKAMTRRQLPHTSIQPVEFSRPAYEFYQERYLFGHGDSATPLYAQGISHEDFVEG